MKHPLLRIILLPIALLYGLCVWLRNKLFDIGLLRQKTFNVPVIAVGNIVAGGTGKTPHTEYLLQLLQDKDSIASLSRGYGRKSKGFMWVNGPGPYQMYGDEPLQIKRKFSFVNVAVCESRVKGIETILSDKPETEAIILDDAFQHRYVKPGINILLVDYQSLPEKDYLLPSGNLRESLTAIKRADVVIVTKTSKFFSPLERPKIEAGLKTTKPVFYTYYRYGALTPITENSVTANIADKNFFAKGHIILLTGIANTRYLSDYIEENFTRNITPLAFKDHHNYTATDIEKLAKNFSTIAATNKIIVTTEKDAIRLLADDTRHLIEKLPVYYLPIEVEFHGNDKTHFDNLIVDYVRSNKANG